MFNRIIYLLIIFLILITSTNAAITELKISPDNPVVGDIITISGITSLPGEPIDTEVSFTKSVTVSGIYYSYNINNVEIPSGSNSFTVTATGVDDLNVDILMSIWWSRSTLASGGIATISESNLTAGTYDVQIYGKPQSGVSVVSLEITASKVIMADPDGNFTYSYSTHALPVGNFELVVGNENRIITLKAPPEKSSTVNSGGFNGFENALEEATENTPPADVESEFVKNDSEQINLNSSLNESEIESSKTIPGFGILIMVICLLVIVFQKKNIKMM